MEINVTVNGETTFDTDSPSLMACQIHRRIITEDPNFNSNPTFYQETIHHGLGYVPAIWAVSEWGDMWDNGVAWNVCMDKQNIYIDLPRWTSYRLMIYIFPVDIEKEFTAEKVQTIGRFDETTASGGIEVKKGDEVTFTTRRKNIPIGKVMCKNAPDVVQGEWGTYNSWRFQYNLDAPVMFDVYARVLVDQTMNGVAVGKWMKLMDSMGSFITSSGNNLIAVDDGGTYGSGAQFDRMNCLIYGKL